jgi:hypothetical protein
MELIVYTPTAEQFVKAIEFNYDDLKKQLAAGLEKYQGLDYDGAIELAKKDRATLNKFKKALDDKRLDVKRQLLDPYTAFEMKIKELQGMVDTALGGIDTQVKEHERQVKTKKRAEIQSIYEELIVPEMRRFFMLEVIWNERWLNTTFSLENVRKEIERRFKKFGDDMNAIKALGSAFTTDIKACYLRTLDIGQSLAEGKRLEDAREHAEDYHNALPETPAPAQVAPINESDRQQLAGLTDDTDAETPLEYAFRVWLTDARLNEFKAWIQKNGIRIAKVKK